MYTFTNIWSAVLALRCCLSACPPPRLVYHATTMVLTLCSSAGPPDPIAVDAVGLRTVGGTDGASSAVSVANNGPPDPTSVDAVGLRTGGGTDGGRRQQPTSLFFIFLLLGFFNQSVYTCDKTS